MTQSMNEEKKKFHSDTFTRALTFAANAHQHQPRKETAIPYISHLMAVSGIVMEAGGTETEWIAALLHDSVEDTEVTLEMVEAEFGADVARIVEACSDYIPARDGDTKPVWHERKSKHLKHLKDESQDVLLVTVADKIHNGESILNDLAAHGAEVWARFNASPIDTRWYYASVLNVAEQALKNEYALGRLRRVVRGIDAAVAG